MLVILFCCDAIKTVLEDELISDVPLLILANKIDKRGFAAAEDEIRQFFALHNLTTGKVM